MLTVLLSPNDYNFAKSPVICEVETDNYFLSGNYGNKAVGLFSVSINPSVGDYIRVVWGANVLQLNVINSTTPTPGSLRKKAAGQTPPQFFAQVLNDILLNPSITADFTILSDGTGGYKFTANLPGAQYSLTGSSVGGANFFFYNNTLGTDLILNGPRENYRIRVSVEMEDSLYSNATRIIYSAEKEPFNNKVRFDLRKAIDASLAYEFPLPNEVSPYSCSQVCKRFDVVIKEIYGTPPTVQATTIINADGSPYVNLHPFAIKGGYSMLYLKKQNAFTDNQLFLFWVYGLFLTHQPRRKKIKPLQQEYLYFSVPDNYLFSDLKLYCLFYYPDGTVDSPVFYSIPNPRKGEVLRIPINYKGIYPTYGDAYKFEVKVMADDGAGYTAISETFTYIQDLEPAKEERIFLFNNSFGGVDTLRTSGVVSETPSFEKDVSTRNIQTDSSPELGEAAVSNVMNTQTIKVSSGWMDKADLKWLEDLFYAKIVVEAVDDGDNFIPITITSKEFVRHKTQQNLYALQFEYTYQFNSEVNDLFIFP